VKEVSAEDDGVLWRVDGVDPAGRDEERVSGHQLNALALVHQVPEESFRLKKTLNALYLCIYIHIHTYIHIYICIGIRVLLWMLLKFAILSRDSISRPTAPLSATPTRLR
jgi:hypothetical protein